MALHRASVMEPVCLLAELAYIQHMPAFTDLVCCSYCYDEAMEPSETLVASGSAPAAYWDVLGEHAAGVFSRALAGAWHLFE